MVELAEVKRSNPNWFDRGNRSLFGDQRYWILHSKTGIPYLLRSTYGWSDMFGQKKKLSYMINALDPLTLKIRPKLDEVFKTRDGAKDLIKSLP